MKRLILVFLTSVALLVCTATHAHHSFSATFSAGNKITVEGAVTKWSFKNPHVLVYFDVTNEDGSITNWVSEGAAASNMRRRGWSKDTFSVGEKIRVTGDRTHDGSPMTSIDDVYVLDEVGQVVRTLSEQGATNSTVVANTESGASGANGAMGGGQGAGGPQGLSQESFVKAAPMDLTLADGRPNLSSSWSRHGMGLGRPPTSTVEFNEIGKKAQDLFVTAVDPQVFCDAPGLIRQAGMTPHPVTIMQYDDRIEFGWEEYGGSRTVYFDDRDFKGYKTRLGDGIARYEGDSLIIETTNLLSNPTSPVGDLTSDEVTLTEIYSRVDSDKFGPVLRIQAIAKGPWIDGEMVFDSIKMSVGDYEFIENECQEPLRERVAVHPSTSFFITSVGLGADADLSDLEGADAHCEALASEIHIGGKDWRAYLSTTGEDAVAASDRIGNGPWYNARGILVASSVENLRSDNNILNKETNITERASVISVDGDGLFYCFASIENTTAIDVDNIVPAASLVSPEVLAQLEVGMGMGPPTGMGPPSSDAQVEAVEASASAEQDSISKLIIAGGLLLFIVIGFFVFRGKGS